MVDSITQDGVKTLITGIVVDPKTGKETPRPVGSQAIKDRQAWLKTQIESWGATAALQPFDGSGAQATNVIGSVVGANADPKKAISMSGHLDTTDDSPGANDDASGVAVSMAALRAIAAAKGSPCLKTRIDGVAFDNEETGTDAAGPYLDSLKSAGVTYAGGFNPDPIGRPSSSGDCINVSYNSERDKPHAELMVAANKKYGINAPNVTLGTYSGSDIDSAVIWGRGLPNVYPNDCSDNGSPHDPSDVLAEVSIPQLTNAAKLTAAAVLELSSGQVAGAAVPGGTGTVEPSEPSPSEEPDSESGAPQPGTPEPSESEPSEGPETKEPEDTAEPTPELAAGEDQMLTELQQLLEGIRNWLDRAESGSEPEPVAPGTGEPSTPEASTPAAAPETTEAAEPDASETPEPTGSTPAAPQTTTPTTKPDQAAIPAPGPAATAAVVTLPLAGAPTDPGAAVVKSPNPSPIAVAAKLTGPRIRVTKDSNPEVLLNGKTLAAGTVVEVERGAVFNDVRVIVHGAGTAAQPVLVTAVGTGAAPVFKAAKPGPNGKDSGILTTSGTHVHVQGLTFAESGSVAVAANAAPTVLDSITGDRVVIGAWVKGDGSKVWNSYFHHLRLMPDTPGPNDDYGAAGVVVEADDVTVQGLTCRECHAPDSPDYAQYGGDGSLAEVWMKGDKLNIGWSYLDGGPRVLEAGGLGQGNSAVGMTVHNTFAKVRKDAPFYMNPDGEYSGLDTTGFVEKDNTIVKS